MADLNDLLNQGLGGIISSGGIPTEDALYNRQAQAERESTFGRGLGISSVTRDALAKARVDASLAAQQAQLSALGQAAGITQGNAARSQQESQFSRNLSQQKSLANQQMLAGGLGAGAGAVANVAGMAFRPEIISGVRGAAGLGPGKNTMLPINQAPDRPVPAAEAMPTFNDPTGSNGGLASLGAAPDFQSGGGGSGGYSMPDLSSYTDPGLYGGLDLSGLFDSSFGGFDPNQFSYGNYT